jgi:uncharacterized Ntn-hydrolase superfamily protein
MRLGTISSLFLLLLAGSGASAQDTFSIVAVDPATGEVGSAGASCVPFDVAIISDLHPGVGAINSQAWYVASNQEYARRLMDEGIAPSAIIDSLLAHDIHDSPAYRQYGIATLAGGGTTAAFTGEFTDDYKGHRLGTTYSVQGNILLGPQILDSIAARFGRATGPLADRLMYALMGARVIGADSRCTPYGTSSLGAFIRVARPGDRVDSTLLDIRVSIPTGSAEPLDSLQYYFSAWRQNAMVDEERTIESSAVHAVDDAIIVSVALSRPQSVRVELFDAAGRTIGRAAASLASGPQSITLHTDSHASSSHVFVRITCGREVITRRVVTTK